MFNSRAKQIPALICTRPVTTKNLPREKMINIGGRPVLVTNPDQSATGRDRADSIKLALAFAAIYLVWGSTYLAIRYAVETIPPLVTAGIRYAIAGTILFAWAWARGFRPTRANWISSCALGALFILVLAWSMGQQKISRLSALGLGLGVLGVALLTGAELTVKGSSLLGLMAVLVGSLSWSAGVVISPRLKLPDDALGRTAIPTLCGAVMLLAAAGLTGEFHATHWANISLKSLLGLAYLIVFGSVIAFTAYTWLLQRCPPALVATHTYANPVVAVFLGWLLASEPLTLRVVLASVAILGAI